MRILRASFNGPTGHAVPPADFGDERPEAAQRATHLALKAIVDSLKTTGENHDTLGVSGTTTGSVGSDLQ